MRALTFSSILPNGILLVFLCACQPFDPLTPPRLEAPEITSIALSDARLRGSWRETVRLSWKLPADSVNIRSCTLLRRTDNDSTFDVFDYSQNIPESFDTFYDDLGSIGFPTSDFFLVRYRMYALDTLGRSGDTSEICSLYLARQPEIDTINSTKGSFQWSSRFIQGSVESYLSVWNAGQTVRFSSVPREEFGSWDYPVHFSATLPDSLCPLPQGTWYYALYLTAMGIDRQSLKVDSINVPE